MSLKKVLTKVWRVVHGVEEAEAEAELKAARQREAEANLNFQASIARLERTCHFLACATKEQGDYLESKKSAAKKAS